jgi:catechol 2,3-dioxygenase-like lactoylglutathione lyase family enzyme
MMYDHVGLPVRALDASLRFYSPTLAALGYTLCTQDRASAGFGPPGEPSLWLYASALPGGGNGTHLAFRARDRKTVDRFHQAGLAAGGRDNGAPGLRADYGPDYYAAFLLDPDGHNLEALCLGPE